MGSDRAFFQSTVNLVFGTLGDKVPRDFIEDRERLRGAKFDDRHHAGRHPANARSVSRPCRLEWSAQ
jgi:hypothetical protein